MSKHLALAAVERMNMQPAFISPAHVMSVTAALQHLARANPDAEQQAAESARVELLAAYGLNRAQGDNKPFAYANGVAIIPVHGTLINRFGGSWSDVTGYNFIRRQMHLADADPDVELILFDVNSYGGEAAGCFELCADICALSKPTMSVIDSASYSAGYAIASSADKIALTPSGGVGSIGVIAMHMSFEKMLENFGIEVTFIFAGDHKADGNPFEALPDSVRKDIQASIDKSYKAFTTLVAENRGLDVQAVVDTQARTYRADDALALGLIDEVATPAQAVTAFFNELSGSTTHQENSMSNQATSQPGAESATTANIDQQLADARKAERERMAGIQNCEEAEGKAGLANHLALNTDLSVDAARAILKAAPAEQAAAKPADNAFAAAMNSSQHPNVGADADGDGNEGEKKEMSNGSRILSDYQAATGIKLQ